jgi:ABC-type sugar transport system substrate-binding protein
MAKHVVSMLAAAVGLLSALGGVARGQEKMTIGISYQNLAFPFVAALQKAAENACKALGADCIEADAVNDTRAESVQVVSRAGSSAGS